MSRSDLVAYAAPARPVSELPVTAFAVRQPVMPPEPVSEAPTLTVAALSAWSMPRLWNW